MAHRMRGQLSLADGLVAGGGSNQRLERINDLLDWSTFEDPLSVIYASKRGRQSYPQLVLFEDRMTNQI